MGTPTTRHTAASAGTAPRGSQKNARLESNGIQMENLFEHTSLIPTNQCVIIIRKKCVKKMVCLVFETSKCTSNNTSTVSWLGCVFGCHTFKIWVKLELTKRYSSILGNIIYGTLSSLYVSRIDTFYRLTTTYNKSHSNLCHNYFRAFIPATFSR